MWVAVNKLNLVPERIVSGFISMFWDSWGLSSYEPYISVMFLNAFMHLFSHLSNVYFATFAGNLVDYSILICWVDSILTIGHTKCDLSNVADLKTVRMPCKHGAEPLIHLMWQNRSRFHFRCRFLTSLSLGFCEALQKQIWKSLWSKNWWEVLLLLRDNQWSGNEVFGTII